MKLSISSFVFSVFSVFCLSSDADMLSGSSSFAGAASGVTPDSVTLTTDTVGNYVATITAGSGLLSTGSTSGEGITHTLSIDPTAYPNVTIGTANGLSLVGQALSLQAASTSLTGALTSTDWNTFNSKAAPGNYITALTTDVVATGPGSVVATIQPGVVTGAKIATGTIAGGNLATNISISTTGNIATTGSGTITSAGAISAPNISGTNTGDVTIGTANGLSLAGQVLSLQAATTSLPGALTAADWNTFNNKGSGPTNTFVQVGSSLSITTTGNQSMTALNSTDIAFIESTGDELRTYRFNGSTWSLVGTGFALAFATPSSLTTLTSSDVAYYDATNDQLRTYRFNGSTWSLVGSGLSIVSSGFHALAALNSADVAYYDTTNDELRTYRFNGSTWSLVGSGLSIVVGAENVALTALNGTDVAYYDNTNDELRTYRFNGSTWSLIGAGLSIPVIASRSIALARLSSTDIAYSDADHDELRTYRFNGSTWSLIGTSLSIPGVDGVSLASLSSTNVAFFDSATDQLRMYSTTDTVTLTGILSTTENNLGLVRGAHAVGGLLSATTVYTDADILAIGSDAGNDILNITSGGTHYYFTIGLNSDVVRGSLDTNLITGASDPWAPVSTTSSKAIATDGIAYLVAVGATGEIYTSPFPGTTWTSRGPVGAIGFNVLCGTGTWWVAGVDSSIAGGAIAYNNSDPQDAWTSSTAGFGATPKIWVGMQCKGSTIVGLTTAGDIVSTTDPSVGWTNRTNPISPITSLSTKLRAAGSYFFAMGPGGKAIKSADGATWTDISSNFSASIDLYDVVAVTNYLGSSQAIYIMIGAYSSVRLMAWWSLDTVTWYPYQTSVTMIPAIGYFYAWDPVVKRILGVGPTSDLYFSAQLP